MASRMSSSKRLSTDWRASACSPETTTLATFLACSNSDESFRKWLEEQNEIILPSSLTGNAIAYTLKQWNALIAYLETPFLTPDNNASENAIRPFVLGRKNWLFSGSPDGAASSCGMYTLIETAKQNNLNPMEYLPLLFEKAPLAKTTADWKALLPWNIKNLPTP